MANSSDEEVDEPPEKRPCKMAGRPPFIRRRCCAFNCNNTDVNKRMFCFPHVIKSDDIATLWRCREWVRMSGNRDLLDIKPAQLVRYALCGDHFSSADYQANFLKHGTIPGLFACKPLDEELMQCYDLKWQIPMVFVAAVESDPDEASTTSHIPSSAVFSSQVKNRFQDLLSKEAKQKLGTETTGLDQTKRSNMSSTEMSPLGASVVAENIKSRPNNLHPIHAEDSSSKRVPREGGSTHASASLEVSAFANSMKNRLKNLLPIHTEDSGCKRVPTGGGPSDKTATAHPATVVLPSNSGGGPPTPASLKPLLLCSRDDERTSRQCVPVHPEETSTDRLDQTERSNNSNTEMSLLGTTGFLNNIKSRLKNLLPIHVEDSSSKRALTEGGSTHAAVSLEASAFANSMKNRLENFLPIHSDGSGHKSQRSDSAQTVSHNPNSWMSNRKVKEFIEEMENLQWVTCETCKETSFHSKNSKKTCLHGKSCSSYSAARLMDPGPVPAPLQGLTYVEEQLIARVHPVISVHKVRGLQLKYSGNVINFPQAVEEFAKILPWKIEDLPSIITVRTGGEVNHCDFYVRAARVKGALEWLQEHNPWYSDIVISEENLNTLPENGNVFSSLNGIDASEQESGDEEPNRSFNEGTAAAREDGGHNESSRTFGSFVANNLKQNMRVANEKQTSHATNSSLQSDLEDDVDTFLDDIEETGVPSLQAVHQNEHVRSVFNWPTVVGEPISEFKTKGYIPKAFPALFPWGYPDLRGEECQKIKATQFFKHLMLYLDQRFAQHPRFRFFAFNSALRWRALNEGNFYVNKNSDMSSKTAEELKRHLLHNPNAMKNIMFYGHKLRGTKPYWKIRSYELLDMIKQLGLPTLFLTLSAADYHWPDLFKLLAPDRDPDSLTEKERQKLVEENPLIVDSFFFEAGQGILWKVQPMFHVKDFWYRIEYQHRGSPHIHGLLWLENAPDVSNLSDMTPEQRQDIADYFDQFICCYHPSPSTPPANDHPCRRRLENIEDCERDLAELLNCVQTHSCNKAYCLRLNKKTGKRECRFKFPKDFKDKSVIELNEDGVFEFYGKRNVDNLNKYNKELIQIWRANIDISPILSYAALVMYLAKYVSKSEPKSKGLEEFLNSCALDEKSARSLVHKILIQSCSERDYSAQEVCHLLMGLPLVFCSRDFVVLNLSSSSDWVPVGTDEEGDDRQDGSSNKGKSAVQKYVERTVFDRLSLWEVSKNYILPSGRKRSKPAVVRVVPKYQLKVDGQDNEKYYRQQALLHLAWNDERKLCEGLENWAAVYNKHDLQNFHEEMELSSMVSSAREELQEDEPLEMGDAAGDITREEYMRVSAMLPKAPADKTELGRREIDLNHDWKASASKYEQYGSLHELKMFIKEKKNGTERTGTNSEFPTVMFNEQQAAVLNILENQISSLKDGTNLSSVPKRIIIQGKAGTGKSLLIQAITNRLQQEFGPDSYLLMAPTGIAALNIGGVTIHSGLGINPHLNSFKPLEGDRARQFCEKMAPVRFMIIDEYSMVGSHLFSVIDERMKQGKESNEDFGGVFVYILGDIRQLPPVGDSPLYQLPHRLDCLNRVRGKMLFSQFQGKVELTHSHRQNDQTFINLLDRLSVGESTDKDYETLKTRFVSKLTPAERAGFEDAIRLFPYCKEVSNFNETILENLKCPSTGNPAPVALIPAKNNCSDAAGKEDGEGLPNVINLAVGCKVMLRTNLWTVKGLVNGAIGNVIDILYGGNCSSPDEPPEVVICSFPSYTGPCLDESLKTVPIPAITRYWSTAGGVQCSRKQFPLSLSYACTIHKSQGLTLSKAVVSIGDKENSCGITYVALSRVKTLSGIMVMDFPKKRLLEKIKSNSMILRNRREKEIFESMRDIVL